MMTKISILGLLMLASFSLSAEQLLKVDSDEAKNPSFYNKLLVEWKSTYANQFKVIKSKQSKILIQVSPRMTQEQQQLFIDSEAKKVSYMEFIEREDVKQSRHNGSKRRSNNQQQ
ncbi:MAG: hypothetical protein HWD86_00860 [Kangiellaceae bacterium]|nr:hypothetical protein [Kangiellaceae bacterium]